MFRFEHPEFFWTLLLPLVAIIAIWSRHRLARCHWGRWGAPDSNERVLRGLNIRPGWMGLSILAYALLALAAVNPQWGFKTTTVESKTSDIYLVLDISTSMLAEDIAPNRLERARRFALDVAEDYRSERIGLILFAGSAYLQSPLTTDWQALRLFLQAADPDQAGTQGTAIGDAIRLAIRPATESSPSTGGALLIITDGEDHDSDAMAAMDEAKAAGWVSYIIGVGTETGSTIPMAVQGRKDVKRDATGQPVMTRLNRSLMAALAEKGGGTYFDLTDEAQITSGLQKELASLERSRLEKRSFSEHKSYFQWFILPAVSIMFWLAAARYTKDVIG